MISGLFIVYFCNFDFLHHSHARVFVEGQFQVTNWVFIIFVCFEKFLFSFLKGLQFSVTNPLMPEFFAFYTLLFLIKIKLQTGNLVCLSFQDCVITFNITDKSASCSLNYRKKFYSKTKNLCDPRQRIGSLGLVYIDSSG